jgi:hypothetical protein
MTLLISSVVVAAIGYGLWKYLRFAKRHAAAMNVVLAKITFDRLSASEQSAVDTKAHEILARLMRRPPTAFNTETERYGWYALAMAELLIPPVIEQSRWNHVRNPFFAVFVDDPAFRLISDYMRRKRGIAIEIDG